MNLNNMTIDKVFEAVATHLLNQGQRSVVSLSPRAASELCAYRGDNGLKCAMGCLIRDDQYKPWMEGLTAGMVVTGLYGDDYKLTNYTTVAMLNELQFIHDTVPAQEWPHSLIRLAMKYRIGLSPALLKLTKPSRPNP